MTDLMSGAALTLFPLIGIVIFALIFIAMAVRVIRSPKADSARHGGLPLEEGTLLTSTTNAPERTDA